MRKIKYFCVLIGIVITVVSCDHFEDRGNKNDPKSSNSIVRGTKDIIAFTILELDAEIIGTSINLTLPYGTDLVSLTPTITHTGVSISPASGVETDFTNPVNYTVTADDRSVKVYIATVDAIPPIVMDGTGGTAGDNQSFTQGSLVFNMKYVPGGLTYMAGINDNGDVDNGPPTYAGATLGGLWRMRGFPSQRFSDKAAIYYAAEYRMIPRWNPFENWTWLQKYVGVQWLQFVPFVEVGRVAPHWSISDLHEDMKWDVGFGLRLWAKGIVVRIDSAVSDEQFGVQMMVAQPFQF